MIYSKSVKLFFFSFFILWGLFLVSCEEQSGPIKQQPQLIDNSSSDDNDKDDDDKTEAHSGSAEDPEVNDELEDFEQDVSASKPLDLTPVVDMTSGTVNMLSKPGLLPDLFEASNKSKDKSVSIGGKLKSNPEENNLIKSVDGAEITVEVKTK